MLQQQSEERELNILTFFAIAKLIITLLYCFLFAACPGHLEKKNDRTFKRGIGGACAKRSDKVINKFV